MNPSSQHNTVGHDVVSMMASQPISQEPHRQGHTQDFPQEGTIFPGDKGTPTKIKKIIGFSSLFVWEGPKFTIKKKIGGSGACARSKRTHLRFEGALSGLRGPSQA